MCTSTQEQPLQHSKTHLLALGSVDCPITRECGKFLPISSKIRATWVPFLHPMRTEERDLQRSQTKLMVLRLLITRQSVNTPRTPMREAPHIHHRGPLLLSVTSYLLEYSPEIRDRKFFRSTAGISLPCGFDDSGSDGQGVCNKKVRPRPFPVTFV